MDAFVSDLYHFIHSGHAIQPSEEYLLEILILLLCIISGVFLYIRSLKKAEKGKKKGGRESFVAKCGVGLGRIQRTLLEIERKTFHLTGLLVPIGVQISTLYFHIDKKAIEKFMWLCTACIWVSDGIRVIIGRKAMNYFPYSLLKGIVRDKEMDQLSGTSYFALGTTLSLSAFPIPVAVTSILWLVLGDMSAALIGVSFGGEACSIKMGREGKKSLEGSVAMFIVCSVCGFIVFASTPLMDYAVIIGSLAATLVELYEPFHLNDNITIPVVSGLALQWALGRIQNCKV
jgi:diacylglycerol kinase (CTP)